MLQTKNIPGSTKINSLGPIFYVAMWCEKHNNKNTVEIGSDALSINIKYLNLDTSIATRGLLIKLQSTIWRCFRDKFFSRLPLESMLFCKCVDHFI
jgi:hypothetical protein